MQCNHCSQADLDYSKDLSTNEILDIINQFSEFPVDRIKFLGGEPTVRDDIYEIINYCTTKGIKCGLTTNGSNLESEKFLNLILENKLDALTVSIDSHDNEINRIIRKDCKLDELICSMKSISKIIKENKLKTKMFVLCVLHKKNIHFIDKLISLCMDIGIYKISFMPLKDYGRGNNLKNILLDTSDYLYAAKQICKVYEEFGDEIILEPNFINPKLEKYLIDSNYKVPKNNYYCGAALDRGYITPDGFLMPCHMVYSDIKPIKFDLKKHKFKDIWSSEKFNVPSKISTIELIKDNGMCLSCEFLNKCIFCPYKEKSLRICKMIDSIQK